jgi:hypothetical protein
MIIGEVGLFQVRVIHGNAPSFIDNYIAVYFYLASFGRMRVPSSRLPFFTVLGNCNSHADGRVFDDDLYGNGYIHNNPDIHNDVDYRGNTHADMDPFHRNAHANTISYMNECG